ncbi:MAG: signal peptidase I [Alphaproteobacteria bacterium 16-39-46]|nr:MAG: signal peptidase I [Alphaproteobacteria bacterium 16-39-46]OZA41829.1 MAG: signal peptidase I [Alphaproteobacteria bacterium 17-39-52]HQS84678.1 signal peptidase I [Alphaproteobacteria bacterium]HQS84689.1 signal peptidase I [Alphaproteobacteria bacterium]HQS93108.1 signal peptidase I [Alphaproteobacteria bacterium]
MKVILGYFCILLLGCWLLSCTYLTINETESLPYRAFFCIPNLKANRGDFVCLKGHETIYAPGLSLTKRLVGLPGDSIEIRNGSLFVEGKKVGPLQPQTKDGKSLTSLKAHIVPKGFVFLSADHPRSFDSRYEEFGFVNEKCIKGRCFGLFPKRRPSE